MIVFLDTQLTVRQNPTSYPTFWAEKLGQNVGIRQNPTLNPTFPGKKLGQNVGIR